MVEDGQAILFAYYYSDSGIITIDDDYVSYSEAQNSVTITNLYNINKVYVDIAGELHNKYQPFHSFEYNLIENTITLLDWDVIGDDQDMLVPDFESL